MEWFVSHIEIIRENENGRTRTHDLCLCASTTLPTEQLGGEDAEWLDHSTLAQRVPGSKSTSDLAQSVIIRTGPCKRYQICLS